MTYLDVTNNIGEGILKMGLFISTSNKKYNLNLMYCFYSVLLKEFDVEFLTIILVEVFCHK